MERIFTLSEAEAILPAVAALLEEARAALAHASERHEQIQNLRRRVLMMGGVQLNPLHSADLVAERDRSAAIAHKSLAAIQEQGVQVKDVEAGLLDFPARRGGRIVLLCWKRGEAAIQHWHGLEEGFSGRKPIQRARFSGGPVQ